MRKLLRPKDLLLLGLANLIDIYEEARDPFGIAADSYKNLYGWVPRRFKHHNFVRLVGRQLKTGNIEKIEKGGEIYLRITSEGEEQIKRDFPLFNFRKKKWDRKWRVVVFDIAETSKRTREILRSKLKELGFGMLQKSVWFTPHDIILDFREFVKARGLGDFVYMMEVSHLLAGDPKVLANKIWRLGELSERYKKTLQDFIMLKQEYIKLSDRHKECKYKSTKSWWTVKKRWENKLSDLKIKYLQVLLSDPFLPRELLPYDWHQEKVLQFIKSIKY